MKKGRVYTCLSGTSLKLLAMLSMVFDHVGDNFFPEQTWMRIIGRIAMPIFAFFVAEGFLHTRDRRKYLLRMGVFALASELPFDLLTAGRLEFGHQNVMCTFFRAILALLCFDTLMAKEQTPARMALAYGSALAIMAAALFLGTDYNIYGVGLVFLFYLFRKKELWFRCVMGMIFHIVTRNMGIYIYGLLGFLPLFLYNGKKGYSSRAIQYGFYLVYPLHLWILSLIYVWPMLKLRAAILPPWL